MPTVTKPCPRHPKFQRHPPPIWGQAPFKAIKSRVKWGLSPKDGQRRAREQPLRHETRVRHPLRHFVTLWLFCYGQTVLPSNVRSRSWQLAHHANWSLSGTNQTIINSKCQLYLTPSAPNRNCRATAATTPKQAFYRGFAGSVPSSLTRGKSDATTRANDFRVFFYNAPIGIKAVLASSAPRDVETSTTAPMALMPGVALRNTSMLRFMSLALTDDARLISTG